MFTNEEILRIALEQSAIDSNCKWEDFLRKENVIVTSVANPSALTSRLAVEILERGKVPFYCCAWSNIKSARNAIKSGFRPAWAQMTVKPLDMINEMNGIKGCPSN